MLTCKLQCLFEALFNTFELHIIYNKIMYTLFYRLISIFIYFNKIIVYKQYK